MTEEQKMKRISEILTEAPKLTEEDIREVNRSYPSYLFRIRKTRELFTSCCGQHLTLEEGNPILDLPHAGEPKAFGYHPVKQKPDYPCPACGKPGAVKELGRTGDRKNLFYFDREIVMKATDDGVLWGIGIHTEKRYRGREYALTTLPSYEITQYWRFEPGKAERIKRPWWYSYGTKGWEEYERLTAEDALKAGWKFKDGFPYCAEHGTGCDIIRADAAAQSDIGRYTWQTHPANIGRYMRYFALCALCTRTVEMLQKAGCAELVEQMVKGKTNGLKWNAATPEELLGLSRRECRAWLAAGGIAWTLKKYKYLRRRLPTEFGTLDELRARAGEETAGVIVKACARYHMPIEKLGHYLDKRHLIRDYILWKDAMEAAEALGMDMTNPLILMPGDLQGKHDEWTAAAGALRQKIAYEKYRGRLRKLAKKYTYSDGTYLIRPPVSAEEITREGKKLRHCVGGYADRHMKGTTTILFLRDRLKPGVPLATIEMHGNEIVQVHGYQNEWKSCPENPHRVPARELYKDILDPWLAWLRDGSKREKKKKEQKETA